ncbi:MAG TPA: preprotein translocase subunit SecA [bacterium]|nr:preprotein translocase subunit SecA [bacterium]
MKCKSERDITRLLPRLAEVNRLEPELLNLSDEQLAARTGEFRERLERGATLEDLLPEAFATVRESARRRLNMRHFDVQILGGIALFQGNIAEMATGEGKTLVATLPLYLAALEGKGAHLVTVNDYLAKRDRFWMGPVYESLGLSVGTIQHDSSREERQAAYNSDITYGTNNEFGFDYLRDNMALRGEDRVQRPLNYAIVDEVDSILIDEARTPLIISGPAEESTALYYEIDKVFRRLDTKSDYEWDEKNGSGFLTEAGIRHAEKILNIENLYDAQHIQLVHHLNQALRAHRGFERDREYLVKDGKVVIVDEFTGRMMEGRRYSDGLHQALEAKEGVKIEAENQTLATITFQNYFRLYRRLGGMTGTAATEAVEFLQIYNLDVVSIPPNRPLIRVNHPDAIYKTAQEKYKAAVQEIEELYRRGQPVLVGTVSIEKSELLSRMLTRRNIPHQVLNAKYHEKEAAIVAEAGRKYKVTIATNMAGRGTDIILGGSQSGREDWTDEHRRKVEAIQAAFPGVSPGQLEGKSLEGLEVVELGGLHILGTERHEARRIDNQLRGRSGRQGDPGSSRFYLSLEDDLMRLFGSERLLGVMNALPDGEPISHPLISRLIENAQRRVEGQNFEIRKQLLDFDNVMNEQRLVIYRMRNQILDGADLTEHLQSLFLEEVADGLDRFCPPQVRPEEWTRAEFGRWFESVFNAPPEPFQEADLVRSRENVAGSLTAAVGRAYQERRQRLGTELAAEMERHFYLFVLDSRWKAHLHDMDHLREGISLRAYGHQDPLIAYKSESFALFQEMQDEVRRQLVGLLFRVETAPAGPAPRLVLTPTSYQHREMSLFGKEAAPAGPAPRPTIEAPRPAESEAPRVGRNDPCPCGSGKKYKKCCGRNAA